MRYKKNSSKYVLRKKHQLTSLGTIYERDWVTIGSKERYRTWDKKDAYYGDGNFVFTTTQIPSYSRKRRTGEWVSVLRYNQLDEETYPKEDDIIIRKHSNDIRDFAYYGSAQELVRASIEDIIINYPPYLTTVINSDDKDSFSSLEEFKELYIHNSNGVVSNLEAKKELFNKLGGKPYEENVNPFSGFYLVSNPLGLDIIGSYSSNDNGETDKYNFKENYKNYLYSNTKVESYKEITSDVKITYVGPKIICNPIELLWEVVIEGNITLYGVLYFGDLQFLTKEKHFKLIPKKEVFEGFFNELDDFESYLLNRESKPYYNSKFITIGESNNIPYEMIKSYKWPSKIYKVSDDYDYIAIDVSNGYVEYLNNLIDMSSKFDEIYCDNIWNRMTHEAIRNYGWSYKREVDIDSVDANIEGGKLLENLLRVYGRGFDNLKRHIDAVEDDNNITYDNYNNTQESALKDKLEVSGWDVISIIPRTDEVLLSLPLGKNEDDKTYSGFNMEHLTPSDVEEEFYRRMNINSNRILSSKGTIESIHMIMGMFGLGTMKSEPDYVITEEYKTVDLSEKKIAKYDFSKVEGDITNFGEKLYGNLNPSDENNVIGALNRRKGLITYYENDLYSGLPIKEIFIKEKKKDGDENITYRVLAPYYNHKKRYDSGNKQFSEFYFQFNGGWGSYDEEDYKYKESMNYLVVVPTVSDLFQIGNIIQDNDVVYVSDLTDYCDFFKDNDCPPSTHYFICKDVSSYQTLNGWKLVTDEEDLKRALYVDGIVDEANANNPHVGYGKYDSGERYWDYLRKPFIYTIENAKINEEADKDILSLTEFNIDETSIIVNREMLNPLEYSYNTSNNNTTKGRLLNYYFPKDGTSSNNSIEKTSEVDDYVLNSKVLILENKINNEHYKKYFNDVIFKYLSQVIPSTCILKLKGFA